MISPIKFENRRTIYQEQTVMRRVFCSRIALMTLPAMCWVLAGCGAKPQPALPRSSQELQALAQQEDAAVYELEAKRPENAP